MILLPRNSAAITAAWRGPVRLEPHEVRIFFILATIITIGSAILSLMGTHLLPLLQARGLNLSFAVGIGMIVGPSQVGARLIEMFAGRRYHPFWTMVASVILVAVAAVMLLIGFPLVDRGNCFVRRRKRSRLGGPRHRPDGAVRPGALSGFDGTPGASAHDRHGDIPFYRRFGVPARRGFLDAGAARGARADQCVAHRPTMGHVEKHQYEVVIFYCDVYCSS